jgi:hypothetical protein
LFLSFVFFSCDENSKDEQAKDNVLSQIKVCDSILNKQYYPSKVFVSNDTVLNIEMELPELEFYSQTKMKIIREMALCSIISQLEGIKGVVFVNYNNKHKGESKYYSKKYLPKSSLEWLQNLATENKTLFDFKSYIVKNIRGDKLYEFDGVVKGIYQLHSGQKITNDDYEDYFEILEQYSLECQGKLEGNHYREFLQRIKFLASDPANFPDFDVNDVNYFLYYNNEYYKKNNLLIKDTVFY